MEEPTESPATEPPLRGFRSRRRWLILLVLLVAAISSGFLLRSRTQEGQWLAGHWKKVETHEESQFEDDLIFEPQGRVNLTTRFVKTGKSPTTQIRKSAGQWTVYEGVLSIRFDRPVLRSLSHAGHQAQVAVANAVTGSNAKLVDTDYSQGRLVQLSLDRFTVAWIDPVVPDKVYPPQVWSRAP